MGIFGYTMAAIIGAWLPVSIIRSGKPRALSITRERWWLWEFAGRVFYWQHPFS